MAHGPRWLIGAYDIQRTSQRLHGSVSNLSVCAEQCVTPAAFHVFTVFNSRSNVILGLVWITVFAFSVEREREKKLYRFILLV